MKKFEVHIDINLDNSSVLDNLTTHCDLSIQTIKSAITKGALWLTKGNSTQRLRRIKKPLSKGQTLHFYYDENILMQAPPTAQLIDDLGDYSVWYKPYGMLSQGSKWSDHCTISRYAETHLTPQRSAFIVHRLDRAATGLILIAHSKNAARKLSEMFEHHKLSKVYQIISHGHLLADQVLTVNETIDNRPATSHFKQLAYNKAADLSLCEVTIETGRKHQIRKHAAFLTHPVLGDRLHGKQVWQDECVNLQLCAVKLSFVCPITGVDRHFQLPPQLTPSLAEVAKVVLTNS